MERTYLPERAGGEPMAEKPKKRSRKRKKEKE